MILRALKPSKKYDAIVVGSGTGGAPLALRLGERGLQVLVVEQGNFLKVARGPEVSPPGKFIVDVLGSRNAPLTFVGGRSKFYGAALYRFRESDFQEVQHEAGVSPRWPITYSDLETYYDEAEVLFRVHGSSDGDPTEPVRKRVYPFPPIPHQPVVNEVVDRLRSTGTSVANIPSGIDYGGEGKCILCSRCDAHFCTLGAKMDAETASMQPALATGNVDLLLEAEVLCVNTNPAGRDVAGVTLKLGNERTDVDAKVVAVCCGFPNSAMLLYRSRTERHPNGLGNHSGALGRYYGGHSVGMIFPLVAWRGMPSVFTKTFAINEFYNGGPGWSYPMGVIQAAGQMPFWREAPRLKWPIARLIGAVGLMCFYMTEALPTAETGFSLVGGAIGTRTEPIHNLRTLGRLREIAVDVFRRAGYASVARKRSPYLWHDIGTVRFGDDPATSVLDPNCQVHDIKGLYVVDASTLPSAGAVNTALTIVALALRTGDHISAFN